MPGSTTAEEDGLAYVAGSIQNNCTFKFGQVTVLFKMYGVSGPMEGMSEGSIYGYSRDVVPGGGAAVQVRDSGLEGLQLPAGWHQRPLTSAFQTPSKSTK